METYRFESKWHFDSPIEKVQEELENLENWPTWSDEDRKVSIRGGGELGVGTLADLEVRGALPFTLMFTLEVTEFQPSKTIAFTSRGNLVGGGKWILRSSNGGTIVTFQWHVGMENSIFNYLAKFAPFRALMERNHHWVMQKTYLGLQRKLTR